MVITADADYYDIAMRSIIMATVVDTDNYIDDDRSNLSYYYYQHHHHRHYHCYYNLA